MQMALDCLILPDSIDITIEDIGGLHDIFEKLVSTLSYPPMSLVFTKESCRMSMWAELRLQAWFSTSIRLPHPD